MNGASATAPLAAVLFTDFCFGSQVGVACTSQDWVLAWGSGAADNTPPETVANAPKWRFLSSPEASPVVVGEASGELWLAKKTGILVLPGCVKRVPQQRSRNYLCTDPPPNLGTRLAGYWNG